MSKSEKSGTYWCCKAEFGEHEDDCPNKKQDKLPTLLPCPFCGASPSTSILASYLVRCELIYPEAVEDPEGFDGGLTMARIYALGRVLFHGEEDLFLNDASRFCKCNQELSTNKEQDQ